MSAKTRGRNLVVRYSIDYRRDRFTSTIGICIIHEDRSLKCVKKRRAQQLMGSNQATRLRHSKATAERLFG